MAGLFDLSSGTGYGRIDAEDAIMAPAFIVATFVLTGTATVGLFGYDFGAPVGTSIAGYSPSIAFLVATLAIGGAYLTNRPDLQDMHRDYTIITAAGAVSLVALEFSSGFNAFVTGSDAVGLIAAVVLGSAFYAVSYLG